MRNVHEAGFKVTLLLAVMFGPTISAAQGAAPENAGVVIKPYQAAPAGYVETLTKDDVHPGTVIDVSTGAVVPACIVSLQVRPLQAGESVTYDENGQAKVAVTLAIGTIPVAMGDIYYVIDPFTCSLLWHARPYQAPNS